MNVCVYEFNLIYIYIYIYIYIQSGNFLAFPWYTFSKYIHSTWNNCIKRRDFLMIFRLYWYLNTLPNFCLPFASQMIAYSETAFLFYALCTVTSADVSSTLSNVNYHYINYAVPSDTVPGLIIPLHSTKKTRLPLQCPDNTKTFDSNVFSMYFRW